MTTVRIRTFTLLCLLFLLLLPWLFFLSAHYLETKTIRFASSRTLDEALQSQVNAAVHLIETNVDKWTDPDWQQQLNIQLQQANLDAAIVSASGQDIYESNPERSRTLSSAERFSVVEDGQLLGRFTLYVPKSTAVPLLAAAVGVLLALIHIGAAMRGFLLKPLENMSAAARQLAAGDWDVQLPKSRITEIAEVHDGFDGMVRGLQSAYRKQEELEEERRFVIAAVAHDLRTPLFALRGYLDGLEQGIAQSPEKMAAYLAVCKEKSAQLDRLVEDLFTFTKMEYTESQLNDAAVDLKHILEKSADSLRPLARQKSVLLSIESTGACNIRGDPHVLERAISNLLDNAVRHTPSRTEIVVQCAQEANKVTFSVRDQGPGFSPDELKRVFEPLYRGEASRSRATGGSGLGLTISQRIVRRHGGELTASNHAEGGALLRGWLPAAEAGPDGHALPSSG